MGCIPLQAFGCCPPWTLVCDKKNKKLFVDQNLFEWDHLSIVPAQPNFFWLDYLIFLLILCAFLHIGHLAVIILHKRMYHLLWKKKKFFGHPTCIYFRSKHFLGWLSCSHERNSLMFISNQIFRYDFKCCYWSLLCFQLTGGFSWQPTFP